MRSSFDGWTLNPSIRKSRPYTSCPTANRFICWNKRPSVISVITTTSFSDVMHYVRTAYLGEIRFQRTHVVIRQIYVGKFECTCATLYEITCTIRHYMYLTIWHYMYLTESLYMKSCGPRYMEFCVLLFQYLCRLRDTSEFITCWSSSWLGNFRPTVNGYPVWPYTQEVG